MPTFDLTLFSDSLQALFKIGSVTLSESPRQTQIEKTASDITEPIRTSKPPAMELNEDGSIKKIIISQSFITRLFFKGEVKDYCPSKEYHLYIVRDARELQTASMMNGQFAETLWLGSTAYGKMESLPLARGKKSVSQERIEEQAMNFKLLCEQYGIIVNKEDEPGRPKNVQKNFQIPLDIEGFDNQGIEIVLDMTVDLMSPISYGQVDYPMAIIDMKLTWDRNAEFGPYSWGKPEFMDHTQGYIYGFILGFPFFYFVMDYNAKNRGYKIIPVNTNLNHPDPAKREEAMRRYKETIELIKNTINRVINHHYHGWYTNPSHENCERCPLDCPDRNKNQEI